MANFQCLCTLPARPHWALGIGLGYFHICTFLLRCSLRVPRELRVRYLLRPPAAPEPPCAGARTARPPRTHRRNHTQMAPIPQMPQCPPRVRGSHTDGTDSTDTPRMPSRRDLRKPRYSRDFPEVFVLISSAPPPLRVRFPPHRSYAGASAYSALSACDISCALPPHQSLRVVASHAAPHPLHSSPQHKPPTQEPTHLI